MMRRARRLETARQQLAEAEQLHATTHSRFYARVQECLATRAAQAPRILVVGGDPAARNAMVHALKRLGEMRVDQTDDGGEALHAAQLYAYDLIVLDTGLSNGVGLALVEELRRRCLRSDVPVVMVSSHLPPRPLDEIAHGAGASAWFTKPLELAAFARRVGDLLNLNAGTPAEGPAR